MRADMQSVQVGFILFSIAAAIICSLWAGALARDRHRRQWPYMLLALAFPLPAVIITALTPSLPAPPPWRA